MIEFQDSELEKMSKQKLIQTVRNLEKSLKNKVFQFR